MKNKLHDAELRSFKIDQERRLVLLDFSLGTGEKIFVKLVGVNAFRGEDLIMQNVVCRMLLYSAGDIDEGRLMRCIEWVAALSDCKSWFSETVQDEWRKKLHAGLLDLVVFEPSAGAQIVAVCERVEVGA